MKAVMYHYVRPVPDDLPFFRYMHIDQFRRQLDWLGANLGFVARDDFDRALETGRPARGVVLTFDDALSDHGAFVMPELERRGLWGIFYVPTGMYESGRLLDVHRIHYVLGRVGGARAMEMLRGWLVDEMTSPAEAERFRGHTYQGQDNDAATGDFKRALNYEVLAAHRSTLLDRFMTELLGDGGERELVHRYYVSTSVLRAMARAGMEIGSHSVTHASMARLSVDQQRDEIARSLDFLEDAIGVRPRTFCYPFGGAHNFTADTQRLLAESGCRFSFSVEHRDIDDQDLRDRPHALPRFDCNRLPFGKAHLGSRGPEGEPTGI